MKIGCRQHESDVGVFLIIAGLDEGAIWRMMCLLKDTTTHITRKTFGSYSPQIFNIISLLNINYIGLIVSKNF